MHLQLPLPLLPDEGVQCMQEWGSRSVLQLWTFTSALEQDVSHRRPSLGRGAQS